MNLNVDLNVLSITSDIKLSHISYKRYWKSHFSNQISIYVILDLTYMLKISRTAYKICHLMQI